MTLSLTQVDAAAAQLREFEGADLAGVPARQLLELQRLIAGGRDAWDLLGASVAGEIARRSRVEDGAGGLARRQGFASPEQLVANIVGGPLADGARLVTAGRVLQPDADTPQRERHQEIAVGLRDGSLTVAKAQLIASTIARVGGDTRELEVRLVNAGRRTDYRRLRLICQREAATCDAVQTREREQRHHDQRSLEITQRQSGQVHIEGNLSAAQGAILITFLDAQVKAAYQAKRDSDGTGVADTRTATQIRADALTALAAHGLDCEAPGAGVKATVIVRVNAADYDRDEGLATCDALPTPISLNAMRQLVMDGSLMRMVIDAESRVLDCGRELRLFNWAQRMALAERDGGCARCHAPISHCIAHHIRWWKRDAGPTDISNGVLLCVRCHTDIHRDNWDITVDENNHVWFTPPAHVDPQRRRQLGGLAALAA